MAAADLSPNPLSGGVDGDAVEQFTGVQVEVDAPEGLDILATTGQASALLVLGDGLGGFMCERVVPLPAPTTTGLLIAGDLNDDAHIDLVVGDPNSGTVSVLMAP